MWNLNKIASGLAKNEDISHLHINKDSFLGAAYVYFRCKSISFWIYEDEAVVGYVKISPKTEEEVISEISRIVNDDARSEQDS